MRKYIDNFLVYGGGVLAILAFCRIDIQTVSDWLSLMSARTAFAIIGIAMFAVGVYLKWREKKVTPRNIRWKVRDWLDAFQIQVGRLEIPSSHFAWRATLPSTLEVWLVRTHNLDRYLTVVASVGTQAQSQAFSALTSIQKSEFWRNLFVEISRSRIIATRNPNDPNTFGRLTIEKLLPITNKLSEAVLMNAIREVDFDAYMLYWTVEFLLDATVAPPLIASGTDTPPASAGPTGPTGPAMPLLPTSGTEGPQQ